MTGGERASGAGKLAHPTAICRSFTLALLAFFALPGAAATSTDTPDPLQLAQVIAQAAQPLMQRDTDYDGLIDWIGEARIVMLGESTHGSAEFIEERARITRRLVEKKGFSAVVLEAGAAPTADVDDYVAGRGRSASAEHALRRFERFPRWTWRNREFAAVVEAWRGMHAAAASGAAARLAIIGMDVYDLPPAVDDVMRHARTQLPRQAGAAKRAYRCFAPYRPLSIDPMLYGRDVALGHMPSCAHRVTAWRDRLAARHAAHPTPDTRRAWWSARAIAASERYYRAVYGREESAASSWNLRELFLAESLDLALAHHGKIIVWAHNTHQGDARHSDQLAAGELTIGQLMRERHGNAAVRLIGLTTHAGAVRAADGWATRDRVKPLLPALAESWTGILHASGLPAFALNLRDARVADLLSAQRLERAVGVNYLPDNELQAHYSKAALAGRFDAVIHIDRTRAVTPLP
jgi:erythromycin esterase-like protein